MKITQVRLGRISTPLRTVNSVDGVIQIAEENGAEIQIW